ncbi:flagellar hook capping FlgD N-terminal domain-containing protein [Aquicoccus sp. G2-2]|uniref:flagellar hook capping FlgD N-terminal domain-containing protein n=1 Tax=Aquicoccus sp. G2-2 TaxID=3092120 RepID=UPI002AE0576C|nr:flagellar hook capping FlgD N-terminal domain-containing protein [Aquicoccus sp. G2-2]MEA1115025.1 flagellar hook capping FlgD N-terminal domain-containing protein [Aquicoccus sp. G2-2]
MTGIIQPASSTPAATAAKSTTGTNADSKASKPVLNSDFQTFLQMLTVQMQNQDPLNPIDSSDYAVQLATFSSVEQQVQTNDLLSDVVGKMNTSGISQLAGWVGMEARTTAPAHFTGSPITLSPAIKPAADQAWLVTHDASGTELTRTQIGLNGDEIDWAGTDTTGAPLPNGRYTFEVENFANDALLGTTPVAHYARVTEAQNNAGVLTLLLDGNIAVASTDINGLRIPD